MRPLIALASLALATASPATCPGAPPPNTSDWTLHRFDQDHFTIRVPQNWRPIPEVHMRHFTEAAAVLAASADKPTTQNFKFGFQMEPIRDWFQCPYFVIDVRNNGRAPLRKLHDIPSVDQLSNRPAQAPDPSQPSILPWLTPGQSAYDRSRNIIWLCARREFPGNATLTLYGALLLTQHGVIQLNAYVPEAQASQFHALFERIASELQPFPDIAYQKPLLETWPILDRLDWSDPPMRHLEISIALLLFLSLVTLAVVLYRHTAAEEDAHFSKRSH